LSCLLISIVAAELNGFQKLLETVSETDIVDVKPGDGIAHLYLAQLGYLQQTLETLKLLVGFSNDAGHEKPLLQKAVKHK
jgi:hypothetical protein